MWSITFLVSVIIAGWTSLMPHPVVAADKKTSRVAVDLYVDRSESKEFLEGLEVVGFVYDKVGGKIAISDAGLLNVWKGDGPIEKISAGAYMGRFEDPAQFAPVFLVVDVVNQGRRSQPIVGGYLDVAESYVDREPYIELFADYYPDCGPIGDTSFIPDFELANFGWGTVDRAMMRYSFGDKVGPRTEIFTADLGSFDESKKVTVVEGLQKLGLNTNTVRNEVFKCPTVKQLPACTRQLADAGTLGGLGDAVFTQGSYLVTRVSGTISYQWADSKGTSRPRSSPFFIDIPILQFITDTGPECGAGGPVERKYKTVKLLLDRESYRIPLPYRGKLKPKQNRRFALSLVADKSSQHVFKVVLELADGTTVSSPEVDLLYFMPRFAYLN